MELAILADAELTERQKQVLLDVYQSFRAAQGTSADPATGTAGTPHPVRATRPPGREEESHDPQD